MDFTPYLMDNLDVLGYDATVEGEDIRVWFTEDTSDQPDEYTGRIFADKYEIEYIDAHVDAAGVTIAKGSTITIDGSSYKLEKIVEKTKLTTRWSAYVIES